MCESVSLVTNQLRFLLFCCCSGGQHRCRREGQISAVGWCPLCRGFCRTASSLRPAAPLAWHSTKVSFLCRNSVAAVVHPMNISVQGISLWWGQYCSSLGKEGVRCGLLPWSGCMQGVAPVTCNRLAGGCLSPAGPLGDWHTWALLDGKHPTVLGSVWGRVLPVNSGAVGCRAKATGGVGGTMLMCCSGKTTARWCAVARTYASCSGRQAAQ